MLAGIGRGIHAWNISLMKEMVRMIPNCFRYFNESSHGNVVHFDMHKSIKNGHRIRKFQSVVKNKK